MDQRFSQITDKLFHKGYNLYPFSKEYHIYSERSCSLIRGTHQRSGHSQEYLIAVPNRDFSDAEIYALRNLHDPHLPLYEVDTEYIVYECLPRINPAYIAQIIQDVTKSAPEQAAHDTHRKIFSSPVRQQTQSIALQSLTSGFNKARFQEITDKLARKGYSLYPYSRQREIEIGRQIAAIVATHERSQHQESYLAAIAHQNLEGMVLQSIKNVCSQNIAKRLYDMDPEYLVFYAGPLLSIEAIDSMIEEFREYLRASGAQTGGMVTKAMPAMLRSRAGEGPESIAYNMGHTVQKTAEGTELKKTITHSTTKKFVTPSQLLKGKIDVTALEGEAIEGYRVRQKLGEGGFGIVYLVEKGNEFAVLKIAKSDQGNQSIKDEGESIEMFNRLLSLPDYKDFPKCIPRIYHSGQLESIPYFVEEFILTLETLKNVVYKSSRLLKFNTADLMKDYYLEKSGRAKALHEKEKLLDLASATDRSLTGRAQPIPIDPLVAAHLTLQLMLMIYAMNANNYHYGDLKGENIGLRLNDMKIIRPDRLNPKSKFEFALTDNTIVSQLEIRMNEPPQFDAVLLDFGSLTRYQRDEISPIFFTPKYMVPNELAVKHGVLKKSFIKDPYTLGLVLYNMVSGLSPFWHVKLSGTIDQQVSTVNALYDAGEDPFDIELLRMLLDLNMTDICREGKSDTSLADLITEVASMLLKGVFKDEITSIIINMEKKLPKYHHRDPSRYQPLKRFSEHDEVWLSQKRGMKK